MTAPKTSRPRGGSRPRGATAATARIEILVEPATKAAWQRAAGGARQLSALIVQAVDVHLDALSRGEGRLAALGEQVLELAREYEARGRGDE